MADRQGFLADRQTFGLSVYECFINNLQGTFKKVLPRVLPRLLPKKRPDLKGVIGRAEGPLRGRVAVTRGENYSNLFCALFSLALCW